jgi:hypothetical protein
MLSPAPSFPETGRTVLLREPQGEEVCWREEHHEQERAENA